jgi:hypothetical protein
VPEPVAERAGREQQRREDQEWAPMIRPLTARAFGDCWSADCWRIVL